MQYVSNTELRHTYPFGASDVTVDFSNALVMRDAFEKVFSQDENCRRIVVAVEQGNTEEISICEDAGMRFVLDVQLRTGEEVSLMVVEPAWVQNQSTEIEDLDLK